MFFIFTLYNSLAAEIDFSTVECVMNILFTENELDKAAKKAVMSNFIFKDYSYSDLPIAQDIPKSTWYSWKRINNGIAATFNNHLMTFCDGREAEYIINYKLKVPSIELEMNMHNPNFVGPENVLKMIKELFFNYLILIEDAKELERLFKFLFKKQDLARAQTILISAADVYFYKYSFSNIAFNRGCSVNIVRKVAYLIENSIEFEEFVAGLIDA